MTLRHSFTILTCILCCAKALWGSSSDWHLDSSDEGWNCEFLALKYFHHSELQRQWASHLLGSYHFKGDERVLDFGCGDGKITAQISNSISKGTILGVDLSPSMIRLAERCFPQAHYPNLTFRQTADTHMDEYDLIYSFCVFHIVPNPIEVLSHLRAQLADDGTLLLIIPSGKNPAFFQAANETFDKYQIKAPWSSNTSNNITMRTLEGCESCLTAAGFEPVSITQYNTPTAFFNKQELVEWMLGTVTPNWQIPLDKAEAFFNDLITRMAELDAQVIDPSGAYIMKLSRIEAIAKPAPK